MPTGTVKWFNSEKGYGFIESDSGQDLFCHYSAINSTGYRTLNEGQRVRFEIEQGSKGPQAGSVVPEDHVPSGPVVPMGPKIVAPQTFVLPPSTPTPGGLKGLFSRSPFGSLGGSNKSQGKAKTISATAAKSILPG